MNAILLVLSTLSAPDYCEWTEPSSRLQHLRMESGARRGMAFSRRYPTLWAKCALERGGKPPRLRITAHSPAGKRTLVDETIELSTSLNPERFGTISSSFLHCPEPPLKRRRGAVLFGPDGRKRWHYPTTITAEVIAHGPMKPLARKTSVEVMCPVCATKGSTASISFYSPDTKTVRFYTKANPKRLQCAGNGGIMLRRYFWMEDSSGDTWMPLVPFRTLNNLQEKLKPNAKEGLFWEEKGSMRPFCKAGKSFVWEVVGIDEYAWIVNRSSYGPSRHIRRDDIEHLRCK